MLQQPRSRASTLLMCWVAGGEVERTVPVILDYILVIIVEAADGPERADAESSREPGPAKACYDAAVERQHVPEYSQYDLRRQSPGGPGAVGVAKGLLDVVRSADERVAHRPSSPAGCCHLV